ncbi:hypothetical protein K438DRAFT_59061 [Mycena galopus ATCC 62051]|nr:hypothetical protein K438DRAFT_59061 [Mycena galopus ATCC 62051]
MPARLRPLTLAARLHRTQAVPSLASLSAVHSSSSASSSRASSLLTARSSSASSSASHLSSSASASRASSSASASQAAPRRSASSSLPHSSSASRTASSSAGSASASGSVSCTGQTTFCCDTLESSTSSYGSSCLSGARVSSLLIFWRQHRYCMCAYHRRPMDLSPALGPRRRLLAARHSLTLLALIARVVHSPVPARLTLRLGHRAPPHPAHRTRTLAPCRPRTAALPAHTPAALLLLPRRALARRPPRTLRPPVHTLVVPFHPLRPTPALQAPTLVPPRPVRTPAAPLHPLRLTPVL